MPSPPAYPPIELDAPGCGDGHGDGKSDGAGVFPGHATDTRIRGMAPARDPAPLSRPPPASRP